MKGLIFSFLAAFMGIVIVWITIPPLIRVVYAKKLFEPFEKRKIHKKIVPSIGGVAIFIGFFLSSFVASNGYTLSEVKYLYPSVILMFFIGLKDDLMILPPKKKLVVQIFTAIMMATIGNFRLTSLSGFLGVDHIGYIWGMLISAFLIVAIVNAFNFIDGIDGLAAGIGIVISAIIGTCFILMQNFTLSVVSFALTGSLITFFGFNVFGDKHKLFMGDTGSLILGVILAGIMLKFIELVPGSDISLLPDYALPFALSVFIIPFIDITRVVFIRLLMKKPIFRPDNNHLHHKLLQYIPNHFFITLIFCGVNLLFVGITLLLIYGKFSTNSIILINVGLGYFFCCVPFKIRNWIKENAIKSHSPSYPD
jgi:UDP-GlcNAc:undecaprenyl-phosphate/decaprenyl-phosphate GlcNAc-1-phosphate transferase